MDMKPFVLQTLSGGGTSRRIDDEHVAHEATRRLGGVHPFARRKFELAEQNAFEQRVLSFVVERRVAT
jgi:hypothetical protein